MTLFNCSGGGRRAFPRRWDLVQSCACLCSLQRPILCIVVHVCACSQTRHNLLADRSRFGTRADARCSSLFRKAGGNDGVRSHERQTLHKEGEVCRADASPRSQQQWIAAPLRNPVEAKACCSQALAFTTNGSEQNFQCELDVARLMSDLLSKDSASAG